MNILDRLLGHDTWTTRQLLLACQHLTNDDLDRVFEIDHGTLRHTFVHLIDNMETWTDLMAGREPQERTGEAIPDLLSRLGTISREFTQLARRIEAGWRVASRPRAARMIVFWTRSISLRCARPSAAASGTS